MHTSIHSSTNHEKIRTYSILSSLPAAGWGGRDCLDAISVALTFLCNPLKTKQGTLTGSRKARAAPSSVEVRDDGKAGQGGRARKAFAKMFSPKTSSPQVKRRPCWRNSPSGGASAARGPVLHSAKVSVPAKKRRDVWQGGQCVHVYLFMYLGTCLSTYMCVGAYVHMYEVQAAKYPLHGGCKRADDGTCSHGSSVPGDGTAQCRRHLVCCRPMQPRTLCGMQFVPVPCRLLPWLG